MTLNSFVHQSKRMTELTKAKKEIGNDDVPNETHDWISHHAHNIHNEDKKGWQNKCHHTSHACTNGACTLFRLAAELTSNPI